MKAFRKSKVGIGLLMLMALVVTAACAPAAAPPQAGQMEEAMSETTSYMPWSPV
jgi:ABC-type glycerol-3-phosphate transport system substrate-binding protein